MKIYFTASISSMNDESREAYSEIVAILNQQGHKVIADHVLTRDRDGYSKQTEDEALANQRKLTKWKKQADIVIAEVSHRSFGVGQEIAFALLANKPVIALYRSKLKPHILQDEGKDLLIVESYTDKNLESVLVDALNFAADKQDIRFNFFISPSIANYLDWISKHRRIPRSVYLRRLIEADMKENKDYSEAA